MDTNLSKALLMAGGLLISIMVISVALYMYTNAQSFAQSNEAAMSASQVESFNRFYTSYMNTYTGSSTIRCIDAVNILNRALEDDVEIEISDSLSDDITKSGDDDWYTADSTVYVSLPVKYTPTFDSVSGAVIKVKIEE